MSKSRIMIVEDERLVAMDLEGRLKQIGYEVVGNLGSGEEAIELCGRVHPDIIVMDVQLQGKLDGIDAAGQIKELYDIPAIFVTALTDSKTILRAKLVEPAGYILKPFDEIQLQTTLEIALYRLEMDKKLKASEARFRSVFWQSPVGIALVDHNWCLVDANPACLKIFNAENRKNLIGYSLLKDPNFEKVINSRHLTRETVEFEFEYEFGLPAAIGQPAVIEPPEEMAQLDGSDLGGIVLKCLFTPWVNNQNQVDGFLVHLQDVTEQRQVESRIQHAALHDALTGLPNRAHFLDRLGSVVERCKQGSGYQAAILFMDLDRFKQVNDSFGHSTGDQLLIVVGRRLSKNLKSGDFVARFGGDEFAVIIENIHETQDALEVAGRICREIAKPILLDTIELHTNVSIGVKLVCETGSFTSDELLRDADTAMYWAKNNGRGQYALFDSSLNQGLNKMREE